MCISLTSIIFTGTSERIQGIKWHTFGQFSITQKDRNARHCRARNNWSICDVWRRWVCSREEWERVWLVLCKANVSQVSIRDECWESSQHRQTLAHTVPHGVFHHQCLLLAVLPFILMDGNSTFHIFINDLSIAQMTKKWKAADYNINSRWTVPHYVVYCCIVSKQQERLHEHT